MRGGADAPLPLAELEGKFKDNARYGGWSAATAERLRAVSRTLFSQPTIEALKEFRR
jgi:hypothetical protein